MQTVNNTNLTSVVFPNHEFGKTADNANLYDINYFKLNLELPTKWSIQYPETEEEAGSGVSAVKIYKNEDYVGSISYDIFTVNSEATDENFYRSVYSQLMPSSMITWDNNYKEIKSNGSSVVSICDVLVNAPKGEFTFPGILAYNKEILVYIMISFENSQVDLLEEDLLKLAESIEILGA